MLVLVTWIFDQVGSLFKREYHVHHVSKSLKPRIEEFRSYLLIKKQFGLDIKLDFDVMHGSLKLAFYKVLNMRGMGRQP